MYNVIIRLKSGATATYKRLSENDAGIVGHYFARADGFSVTFVHEEGTTYLRCENIEAITFIKRGGEHA